MAGFEVTLYGRIWVTPEENSGLSFRTTERSPFSNGRKIPEEDSRK
jgi:hypothetical protein